METLKRNLNSNCAHSTSIALFFKIVIGDHNPAFTGYVNIGDRHSVVAQMKLNCVPERQSYVNECFRNRSTQITIV